jgi:hypothetical protein
VGILKRLREFLLLKRHELWPKDRIPHHGVFSSSQGAVKQFPAQKSIIEMKHPSYPSDVASSDFWLFPKIKSALKGRRLQDTEHVKQM